MAIKFVKLINGDELIAEVEDKGSLIILTQAAKISTEFSFEATPAAPKTRIDVYCPHVVGLQFKVNWSHVLFCEDPHPSIETYYKDSFVAQITKTIEAGTNV